MNGSKGCAVSAGCGGCVWLLLAGLGLVCWSCGSAWPVVMLLALVPLVLVPLGLASAASAEPDRTERRLLPVVRALQPLAAIAVIPALSDQGRGEVGLACVWLLWSALAALGGLLRLRRGAWREPAELSQAAALLFLPVGAFWLVVYCADVAVFGFSGLMALLTAVHFHYAGFAANTLSARLGRSLGSASPKVRQWHRWSALAILCAPPLLAAAFTVHPALHVIGAAVLTAGLLIHSALVLLVVAPRTDGFFARCLLEVSAAAVLLPMALACAYAWSWATGTAGPPIPQMVRLHGTLNALGFSLCGMLGWHLRRERIES